MIGQFDKNIWSSIKNKWNDTEPLCVNPSWTQISIPTVAPNGCADDYDCDDSDTLKKDAERKENSSLRRWRNADTRMILITMILEYAQEIYA